MNPLEYGEWYYIIYLVPGGAALLTLALSMMAGGARHHRAGASGGHHTGAQHAGVRVGGHHGGLRQGGNLRTAGHARVTAAHHQQGGAHRQSGGPKAAQRVRAATAQVRTSIADQALGLIGFGRIPAPFVWGSLLLGWGIFGFWATRMLEQSMRHPALFVMPSMVIAAVGALGMARMTSTVLSRVLPEDESLAVSTIDLCGLTGSVAFPVDETRGRVHVYDDYGTLHDCSARTAPGQPAIGRGKTVLVVDYDPARDQIIVEESL